MADELHHKKHPRSIWSFYRHGFSKALKKSLEKYGWAILIFGLLYTIVAFFISSQTREEKFRGFDMSFWLTYAIPGALLLFFLVYHVVRAPYEIYLEIHKKQSDIEDEFAKIKNTKPELELLLPVVDSDSDGKNFCRVVVKNKSKTGTAKSVKVELININPHPDIRRYSYWIGEVPFPFWLKPSDPCGEEIHPDSISKFDVLSVQRGVFGERESEYYCKQIRANLMGRPTVYAENYKGRFVVCEFCPLFLDENNAESGNKEYLVKIKISAENVLPIEKTFKIIFSLIFSEPAVKFI